MEDERWGTPGPFDDLEVIRVSAGMPTSRWCAMLGIPERTWRRRQARARSDADADATKGPWPAPVRADAQLVAAVRAHATAHPTWGYRRVWALVREQGYEVSESSVLRILREGEGPAPALPDPRVVTPPRRDPSRDLSRDPRGDPSGDPRRDPSRDPRRDPSSV